MATKKIYTVVLYEQAAEELGKLIALWLRRDELGSYIYARKVDPNGPYFHMVLDENNRTAQPSNSSSRFHIVSSKQCSIRRTSNVWVLASGLTSSRCGRVPAFRLFDSQCWPAAQQDVGLLDTTGIKTN